MSDLNKTLEEQAKEELVEGYTLLTDLMKDSFGTYFTDSSFQLPTDVDFLQDNMTIDLFNSLTDSELSSSFFLEAPFTTIPGFYNEHKAFAIQCTPLFESCVSGLSANRKKQAALAKALNENDGDTLKFALETLKDGNTPFVVGNKNFTSFKEMVLSNFGKPYNSQDEVDFKVRFLGMNAPEVTHWAVIPYDPKNEPETFTKTIAEVEASSERAKYVYQYGMDKKSTRKATFTKMGDKYVECELNYRHSSLEYTSYDKEIRYMRFVSSDDSSQEHEQITQSLITDIEYLFSVAKDSIIIIDHKTLTMTTDKWQSPYTINPNKNFILNYLDYILNPWKEFFNGPQGYLKVGYNFPGQDTYNRFLGAFYLKLNVDDLNRVIAMSEKEIQDLIKSSTEVKNAYDSNTSTVWINLNKLLIYKNKDEVVALPDYSSSPTEQYYSGFVSNIFKLWTYDIANFINMDSFMSYTDEFIVQRNDFFEKVFGMQYEKLLEYYMIIGDTALMIPPTSIRCITQTNHQRAPLMRSRGSAIKGSVQSQRVLEMSLFFNEEEGINGKPIRTTLPNGQAITYWMNGLRSLIAQFHLTPFLPIENKHINKTLNIDAVTLESLRVETIPDYPRTLKAVLTLREFNYNVYMPELSNATYDDEHSWKTNIFARCINYPLMRWYYQRLLSKGNELSNYDALSTEYINATIDLNAPALVPMKADDPTIRFFLPDREYMEKRLQEERDREVTALNFGISLTEAMKEQIKKIATIRDHVTSYFSSDRFEKGINTIALPRIVENNSAKKFVATNIGDTIEESNNIPVRLFIDNWDTDRHLISYAYDFDKQYHKEVFDGKTQRIRQVKASQLNNGESLYNTIKSDVKAFYDDVILSCSPFGMASIEEEITSNGVVHKLMIPLPVIEDIAQQIEFKKYLTSNFSLTDVDAFMTQDKRGVDCIRLDFMTTGIKNDSNVFIVEDKTSIMKMQNENHMQVLEKCWRIANNIDSEQIGSEEAENIHQNNKYETVDSIPFVEYYVPDMIVSGVSIGYTNALSEIILKEEDGSAFQYLGGQDVSVDIQITTRQEESASLLNLLPRLSATYTREYREILSAWPLRIDSQITKFFGVNEVLVESVQVDTVPNFPGVYEISLRLISVDRTTRTKEALKKISVNATNESLTNGGEYAMNNYFDLKKELGKAELYPDLALPTIDELSYAGFRFDRYNNGQFSNRTYVDPDFYFMYGHDLSSEVMRAAILKGVKDLSGDMKISDMYGAGILLSLPQQEDDTSIMSPYDFSLNDVAKKLSDTASTDITPISYDVFRKEMFMTHDYYTRKEMLECETFASLKTQILDITDEIRFAFREKRFTTEHTNEDNKYRQVIYDKAQEQIDQINAILSKPIDRKELSKSLDLYSHNATADNDASKGVKHLLKDLLKTFLTGRPYLVYNDSDAIFVDEDELYKWAEGEIKTAAKLFTEEYDDLFNMQYASSIEKYVLAAADAASGATFQSDIVKLGLSGASNQNFMGELEFIDGIAQTEVYSQYAKSWRFRPYYCGRTMESREVIPLAQVNIPGNPSIKVARTLEEAVSYGNAFGCFQIRMEDLDVALFLAKEEDKNKIVSYDYNTSKKGLFIDDYYRDLQINNPNSEELRIYITECLFSPGYSAIAHLRNCLVWYRKMLQDEIALSMHQIAQEEALVNYTLYNNYNYVENPLKELTQDQIKEEESLLAYFYDVFYAILYSYAPFADIDNGKGTDSEKANGKLAQLIEIGVPTDLHEKVLALKKKEVRELSEIEKELTEGLKTEGEQTKREIMEYFKNIIDRSKTDITVLSYFASTFLLYETQRENQEAILMQSSDKMERQGQKIAEAFANGNNFMMNMACLAGKGSFYDLIKDRKIVAVEQLLTNINSIDVNVNMSMFKKYVLALEGRGVLNVNALAKNVDTYDSVLTQAISESVSIARSNNVIAYLKDSYLDMIQNDKRGRMIRAFPTYYMLFIDEGRKIGLWKLHDNFYNMNAITDITVTKSRKIAADTAEISMTNLLKTFTTEEAQTYYYENNANVKYDIRDAFSSIFSPRVYFLQEELRRTQMQEPTKAKLSPGVRIHVRMGYGSDASTLPIVFNGTIAEVQPGEIVNIVAQGDGIELMNPLIDVETTEDIEHKDELFIGKLFNSFIDSGVTPRQLLVSLMTSKGTWMQNQIRKLTDGRFFNSNPYGIVHFGDPDYKEIFKNGEVGQNIFEVCPVANWGGDGISKMTQNYTVKDIPNISINVYGKSYWDLMHICASTQPDYICSIVPFGLRSSVFLGSGRYYYAYDYETVTTESGQVIIEKRKPFQQRHIYTSSSDIIHNTIKATSKRIKTNAIGIYTTKKATGDKTKKVGPLYVDYDIYPEYQKTMTVDTQYYAKGYPLIGTSLSWNANYSHEVGSKAFSSAGAKEIAWRMTASALRNNMKDMYDGEITVIGDASIKPYDIMTINDTYEDVQGTCEVEAVVLSMNASTGFTTSIYADCISIVDDRYRQYEYAIGSKVAAAAITAEAAITLARKFKMSRPMSAAAISKRLSGDALAKAASSFLKLSSSEDKKIAKGVIDGSDYLRRIYYGGNGFSSVLVGYTSGLDDITNVFESLLKTTFKNDLDELTKTVAAYKKAINKANSSDVLVAISEKLADSSLTEAQIKALESAKLGFSDANSKLVRSLSIDLSDSSNKDILKAIKDLKSNVAGKHPDAESILSVIDDILKTNKIDDARKMDALGDLGRLALAVEDTDDFKDNLKHVQQISKGLISKADDVKDSAKLAKKASMVDDLLDAFKLAKMGTFVGIAWTIVETIIFEVIASSAIEWLYRSIQNLEVLQIYPMKRRGYNMVAGITGHKGSVAGTFDIQGDWTNLVCGLFSKSNKSPVVGFFLEFLVGSEITQMADQKLRTNGIPNISVMTEVEKQELVQSFQSSIENRLNKLAMGEDRSIMRLPRIKDISSSQNKHIKESYLMYMDNGKELRSSDIETKTLPIFKSSKVKEAIESQFLTLRHASSEDQTQIMYFNNVAESVPYYYDSYGGTYNFATLREEALLILEDVIDTTKELLKKNKQYGLEEKRIQLLLTSATIMNERKKSWENTGLCFRIVSFTIDVEEIAKALDSKYKAVVGDNFMQYFTNTESVEGDAKKEIVFMANPLKERS